VRDTIILDSKKRNAELLTIHADGRITVAEHLKPTETAAKVLQIMREQWMDNAQSTKIRKQEDRIKRLEEALRQIANQDYRGNRSTESQIAFEALKEANL
jgi:polyphosphate kinase